MPDCKIEAEEVETQFCHLKPTKVCGAEKDGEVIFQHIERDEPVCVEIVSKICHPAKVPEDGCKDITRKECVPSEKIVDVPSGKIPDAYAGEDTCRMLPKGECKKKMVKLPKRVCEPIGLDDLPLFYGHWW